MTATTGGTILVQFSKDTNDNWNRASIGDINTDPGANASKGQWTNHPAFKFGDTELTGFWMAKFQASKDGSNNVKIIPNATQWIYTIVNDIFNITRSMELNTIYGWDGTGDGIDTHLTKNIEWGAVTYLTQSSYGINGNIGINNKYNKTGCGSAPGSGESSTCNTYDTTGVVASTTGNIYGIYDMSGGVYEFVSAHIDNSYADDLGGSIATLTGDDVKYKDVYETSSVQHDDNWYGDFVHMPYGAIPWFLRGSCFDCREYAGIFAVDGCGGEGNTGAGNNGFRPVLLVGAGL